MRPTRPSPRHVWICTFAEYDADGTLIREEGYWYEGPVARATEMNPTFDQVNFRVRSDTNTADGGTPTWESTENQATNIVIDVDTTFRVRFTIQNDGNANTNDALALYAAKNGGSYTIVSTARSDGLKSADASTDADSTAIATGNFLLTAGAGTASAGVYDESGQETHVLNAGDYTEIEFGLTLDSAQLTDGDYFDLRVYSDADGGALTAFTDMVSPGTYDNVPRIEANEETAVTASGNATLTAVTSSGTVQTILGASGTATLSEMTASGAVQTILGASGTPSIADITATGLVAYVKTASGSPSITNPTASGNTTVGAVPTVISATDVAFDTGTADPTPVDVTVPSGCTLALLFWDYYSFPLIAGQGLASATLESVSPDSTYEQVTDASLGETCGVAVWENPGTGANQTIDVTWDGAPQVSSGGPVATIAFLKNAYIRDVDQDLAGTANPVSVTLTTVSGDLVLKHDALAGGTAPSLTSGWTNELVGSTNGGRTSRLSSISATGSTQVCDSEDENYSTVVGVSFSATPILPASGTPELTGPTASGNVETTASSVDASGNATLAQLTATGTAGYQLTASGTPEMAAITASGEAHKAPKVYLNTTPVFNGSEVEMTVTAWNEAGTSITFNDAPGEPTGSVYLAVENRESGDFDWIPVTINTGVKTASGTATITAVTASGSVTTEIGAYGTPSIAEITASGTAGYLVDASGTPTLTALTSSGSVTTTSAVEASGNATLGEITASGTVTTEIGAYGTPTLTELTASGTAGYVISATGAAELTAITASGSVSLEGQVNASGNATLTAMTASGAVETILGAYGAATLTEITASGTVETTTLEDVLASGTPTLAEITASGSVETQIGAYGTATLAELTASGAVTTEIGAYGAATLQALVASGLVGKVHEVSGTPALAALTSSGFCSVPGLSLAAQVVELTAVFDLTKSMTAVFDPDKAMTATFDVDKAMTAKADSLDG